MLKQSTKKQTQKGTGNSPPRKDRTFTTKRNGNRFFKWQLSSQGNPKLSKGLGGSAGESGVTPLPDTAVSGGAALAGPGKTPGSKRPKRLQDGSVPRSRRPLACRTTRVS